MSLEQLEKDIESAKSQVNEASEGLAGIKDELESLQEEFAQHKVNLYLRSYCPTDHTRLQMEHDKSVAKLKKERATLTRFDEELAALDQVINEKKQEIAELELEHQRVQHELKTGEGSTNALAQQSKKMEQKYPWIEDEKRCAYLPCE